MRVKLLIEHNLEFLGSSESTLVKVPHCWKSHVTAHYDIGPAHEILVPMHQSFVTTVPSTGTRRGIAGQICRVLFLFYFCVIPKVRGKWSGNENFRKIQISGRVYCKNCDVCTIKNPTLAYKDIFAFNTVIQRKFN